MLLPLKTVLAMKTLRHMATALVAMAVLALAGCRQGTGGDAAGDISNFDVHEVLKSATRSFRVCLDGDTFYLSVYTSVQWPVKFGDAELQPLRDSLLTRMYGPVMGRGADVDRAIGEFLANDTIFGSEARMTVVDSIPFGQQPGAYEIEYTAKLMELTERTVTYQITNNSYLGGAHPNYAAYPFTYDLLNGELLTPRALFKPGSEASLLQVIKETLAMQEGVSVGRLAQSGIFVDNLYVSPLVYVRGGGLVFHYNPYDIAPYAKGAVDVEVPAYELAPYLTARADSLINQ